MRKRPIALAVMALVLNLLLCQCGGGSSQKQDATNTGDQLGGLDTSGGQDSTSGLDTSGGLDSTGACTPGQTRCADQTRLETCNSNGIGWSSTTCGNGCNNMVLVHACYPTCKPNDKFCDGDGYQKCNDEGTAYTFVPCEFGCNGNINPVWCYDACRPGSTRCKDATTLETCPADGTDNWTQTTCGANGCNPLVTPAICSTTCPVLKNRCKDGQTQETCNDASTGWDSYSCPSGCQNDACAPLMISSGGWSVVNYDVVNGGVVQSEWKVGGSGVTQKSTGADPTIYLYDTVLSNVRIRGSFSMNTISGWNGSVGFVFGYQDAGNYYLLEWRNGEGDDCGTKALSGLRLKKVQTTPAGSMPDTCPVFWTSVDGEWTHQGNPSAKTTVTMLPGGISANWAPKRTFEIIIDYRPGQIQIVLREGDTIYATITSNDNTFASGKFGFYNNNVYEALYQNFTILSLP